ncbi:MAG: hypothetical protein HFE46_02385 [Clostridia bacterium]|jgi:hypothetical protein|nr:hypothetical protein [Clostridia bacterium]
MAGCLVIGQNASSRLCRATAEQVRSIMQMLIYEKGVTDFYAWGNNKFELHCGTLLIRSFSDAVWEEVTEYVDAAGFRQGEVRCEVLGRWANCPDMRDVPPYVIERATVKLVRKADFIIAGMERQSDRVAAVQYGLELGKPVWKVFA